MGLSLDARDPVWGCLRNAKHRGRDPARLVAKLLNMPFVQAQVIVKLAGPPVDDFDHYIEVLRDNDYQSKRLPNLPEAKEMPGELRPILTLPKIYRDRYERFLESRGFGPADARRLLADYELYGALSGSYAWRLTFPIYARPRAYLVGWTGREIRDGGKMRYLTTENLPNDAVLDFGGQSADGLPTLICEGPMDALKLDFYGADMGLRAAATMGTGAAGLEKAVALRAGYKRLGVVFDADATAQALAFAGELGAKVYFLPAGYKDPGELPPAVAKKFLENIAERACI
jgi:hypothetical protein